MNALELDNALSAALRLRKFEIKLGDFVGGGFHLFHAIDLFQLALRLRCLGVFCAEPVDEIHQAPDLAFLVLERRDELLLVRFPLDKIIVIPAAVPNQAALANLDDASDDLIEEFPIV